MQFLASNLPMELYHMSVPEPAGVDSDEHISTWMPLDVWCRLETSRSSIRNDLVLDGNARPVCRPMGDGSRQSVERRDAKLQLSCWFEGGCGVHDREHSTVAMQILDLLVVLFVVCLYICLPSSLSMALEVVDYCRSDHQMQQEHQLQEQS